MLGPKGVCCQTKDWIFFFAIVILYIDGLVQEKRNSSALAMEFNLFFFFN